MAAPDNRLDLPAVVQAAVAHAQFETIHPYGDGNGRTGRILIDWILRRRQVVNRAVPPFSLVIARRPDDYVVGLYQFRQGNIDAWVKWFGRVCVEAGALIATLVREVEALLEHWDSLVGARSDAIGGLIDLPQL